MTLQPAVVVTAYNRPAALQRLLESIGRARHPSGVELVISIDGGGSQSAAVRRVAEGFEWPAGHKRIIAHGDNLGLVQHVYFCGDLSREYGSIIRLEDDHLVSAAYYTYAAQALDFYRDDPRVAAITLYSLWFNGYTQQPFVPYLDDGDVFFVQVAWSHGQAYTREQWEAFTDWRDAAPRQAAAGALLHEMFARFRADEWFPEATRYLVLTGRYTVFPRESVVSNFGDAGSHFGAPSAFFQVPLQHFRREFRFQKLDEAIAVYDSFQEIQPDRLNRLTDRFAGYDYAVDLYGTKSAARLGKLYMLTSQRCDSPIFSFGKAMWPIEANTACGVPGGEIFFAKSSDVKAGWLPALLARKSNHDYFTRRRSLGRRARLQLWLAGLLGRLGL